MARQARRDARPGRNDPCPCGSGKKYKVCCLRGAPLLVGQGFSMVQESMFLSEECMHPDAGPETCSGTAIRSHTVSRQSALNRIAENGHVMVLRPGSDDDADPAIRAHRVGVSSASTFTGFCATHDEPIDKADLVPTPEQAFLLAYRSLCRDAFMRRGLLNKTKEIRDTLDPDGKIWGSALRRDGHPVTSGMPRR